MIVKDDILRLKSEIQVLQQQNQVIKKLSSTSWEFSWPHSKDFSKIQKQYELVQLFPFTAGHGVVFSSEGKLV